MSLRYLTAGESHGPALNAILEGMPAGLRLDAKDVNSELARRQRGFGAGKRMQIEKDRVEILSGVMAGETTGGPISLMIVNADHKNWQNKAVKARIRPRPGHADLTGAVKYGYHDFRQALERASARETAVRVAIGAICKRYLAEFEISVGGYVREIGGICAHLEGDDYMQYFKAAESSDVRCPDVEATDKIKKKIAQCIESGDTLGGVIEVVVLNVPMGLGTFVQADRRLDAQLAQAIVSIPAIKGMEIGDALSNARQTGLNVHDAIYLEGQNLTRKTNRAGGLEGGISNGMPIVIRAFMKPIATTLTPQQTVNILTGKETQTHYERSDHCPVPRAVPVTEAAVTFVIANALIEKLGGDSIAEMQPRYETLRKARLDDLLMDGEKKVWWS